MSYFLNMAKAATQSELNHFFQIRDQHNTPRQIVTDAAFFKARLKFSATAFIDLNQAIIHAVYQQIKPRTWKGHRILAVDGVKYHLPDESAIRTEFGGQSNQHTDEVPMALGSTLYDVFQEIVLDARLLPYRSDERAIACQHLDTTQAGDLVLYDRGYPAFWLMPAHRDYQRDWCMRVKANFNAEVRQFVASGNKQQIVTLAASDKARYKCQEKDLSIEPITVRLLRIKVTKPKLTS